MKELPYRGYPPLGVALKRLQHGYLVYFIDPGGRERYVAVPLDEHTASKKAYLPGADLAAWGHGVALVTRSLATSG